MITLAETCVKKQKEKKHPIFTGNSIRLKTVVINRKEREK